MGDETTLPTISWDTLLTSFRDEDFLGSGAFSTVYRCYHNAHGDVAVKILNASGNTASIKSFDEEGKTHLRACSFPHILNVIGLTQKVGFVGLVLEYMPYGSLGELISNKDISIPWTFRLRALSETASAMAYLHNLTEDKRVIHCDIKCENILLNADLHVKISDFGGASIANYTSATVQQSVTASKRPHEALIQYTLSYAAPELLKKMDSKRTAQMDIYSFAVVLYTVASRKSPFSNMVDIHLIPVAVIGGQRPQSGLDEVKQELERLGNDQNTNIFNLFQHLMTHCWKQNPKDRLPMIKVRDSLRSKLSTFPEHQVFEDVFTLKRQLNLRKGGRPDNPITVYEKYEQIRSAGGDVSGNRGQSSDVRRPLSNPQSPPSQVTSPVQHTVGPQLQHQFSAPPQQSRIPQHHPTPEPRVTPQTVRSLSSPHPPSQLPVSDPSCRPKATQPRPVPRTTTSPTSSTSAAVQELENSFADPYFRMGNTVRMISDIAAIKNAQVGHGGWNDNLRRLLDMEGTVRKVDDNGDVTVSFSGVQSHKFNPNALVKIYNPESSLHVGDFVIIELDKDLVQLMQEGHGGYVEGMQTYFSQQGLVFRFLPDRDVLVVYKNGEYFRYNPDVLCRLNDLNELKDLCLPDNPNIKIGDYVCHDLDEEVIKDLQETCGGWNDIMSGLRGRVGKFVYVDYHGRAFVAYDSKMCFVFNPAVITKLSNEEACRRFMETRNRIAKAKRQRAAIQIQRHRFAVEDIVRVHLPLDIVVELQRGHGGWCYQMLEVYGLKGVVRGFDDNGNAQVLFDTGTKWTFNPAALEKLPKDGSTPPPSYEPPFKIGDKVRVQLNELTNQNVHDLSFNKLIHAFRLLDIPEEKVDILMKTGTVLGIDDDIDVIVSFGDGKNYGLKPHQLQKL